MNSHNSFPWRSLVYNSRSLSYDLLWTKSKSYCDWQSVSQSVLMSYPIWGIWPGICLLGLILRKLQSCLCGRPLWREVGSFITLRHGPHRKHIFRCFSGKVFTWSLPSTGYLMVVYSLPRNVFTGPSPSNGYPSIVGHALVGICLPSRCIAVRHNRFH
jgi:hypothetical protein